MQLINLHLQSDVLCSYLFALGFPLLQQILHKTSITSCFSTNRQLDFHQRGTLHNRVPVTGTFVCGVPLVLCCSPVPESIL